MKIDLPLTIFLAILFITLLSGTFFLKTCFIASAIIPYPTPPPLAVLRTISPLIAAPAAPDLNAILPVSNMIVPPLLSQNVPRVSP